MNLKEKELIIFDLDGTLINSIPDLTLAINKTLKKFDLAETTVEELTPSVGNGAKTLVKRALEHAMDSDLDSETLDEAFEHYTQSYRNNLHQETYLYPNVKDTLAYLSNEGYKMVICTNKPFEFVEPIIDSLDIKKYFETWIGENSLDTKKPDAAPLLYLVDQMKSKVENAVMIGDSKNDILAAKNAKMDSIGLSYGYNYNENIADYNPTLVVDNFEELQKVF